MSNAERIARLEALLVKVTRRAHEPRPARGSVLAAAVPVPAATQSIATASAPTPAPVTAPAPTPAGSTAEAEAASTTHTRATTPPPADDTSTVPDLEFSEPPRTANEEPASAADASASDEFDIPSHASVPMNTRRPSTPPPSTAPMSIDLEVSPPSTSADLEMEIDRTPLAVHAQSIPPPAGASDAAKAERLAPLAARAVEIPQSEDEAERFAAPLLSDPDAIEVAAAEPAGPPSFRALLLRSLSLRPR